jgi:hypothetical protein
MQRAVLVLRYYEGLSDPGIASLLDVAPGTVRRLRLAGAGGPAHRVCHRARWL